MVLSDRLELFQNMIGCCHDLYLWTYDEAMALLQSNCPDETVLGGLLAVGGHLDDTLAHAQKHQTPLILNNDMDLTWVAEPEWDERGLRRVHVLGPFFMDDVSTRAIEEGLRAMELSIPVQREALRFLRSLPVISLNRALEYAVMLHYCVTGERIGVSDMEYRDQPPRGTGPAAVPEEGPRDLHGTYEAEREMLRMVREGDLNLTRHMDKMATTGSLGKLGLDPMRSIKNAVEVCITLFSRAAIDGGLSPEVSFTLTDHYFQRVEACTDIPELTEISLTMQRDFVERVHRCREDTTISRPIRACMDYMDLHLEDELTLAGLARLSGYSDYYISRRFKKETGLTPGAYLRQKRLERAKFWLETTQLSVQEIAERLRFCSPSYFTDLFRKAYGVTPSDCRAGALGPEGGGGSNPAALS